MFGIEQALDRTMGRSVPLSRFDRSDSLSHSGAGERTGRRRYCTLTLSIVHC